MTTTVSTTVGQCASLRTAAASLLFPVTACRAMTALSLLLVLLVARAVRQGWQVVGLAAATRHCICSWRGRNGCVSWQRFGNHHPLLTSASVQRQQTGDLPRLSATPVTAVE